MILLAVALGGAAGAVSRYWVSDWVRQITGGTFPWGTFVVNATGSLALGFLLVWLQAADASAEVRALLTVGLLGSFTTFSTFSLETAALLQDGAWARAGVYAAGSLLVGLLAVMAGAASAQLLLQARG